MPIEIYRGVLDPDQLEGLRLQLENFAIIDEVDPELRGIIERNLAPPGSEAAARGHLRGASSP
ncbi:hypothetical protein NLM27_42500 [Bradyrhizobium sp. CCGB12]|uniref:hypothetical protein n=1 Tax=Bradyrhizobium sp. CCGB12 TaxID=2949632 RepID=UPI0020B29899|nr:hypothetical protein [Bradyrhizobium sp. CCGB12]MCP3395393.1 hypothetical protein [Bradyrhizobium sp. CCGB12]